MTLNLRPLLLLLLGLACLASALALAQPARADGRADWQGYSWQKFAIASCLPAGSTLVCPAYHQKWDWKRHQWVDIAIGTQAGRLNLSQQLTNRDPRDDDDVCVTMLVLDAAGRTILAHHQNWHSRPGTVMQDDFVLRSGNLAAAASVHIGSKQCRKGSHQDDAVHAAVLAGIAP